MKIHCCSFASESFEHNQNIQEKYFLEAGFRSEYIHLFNPNKLSKTFYLNQPNASEFNKFGWFSFKPFMLEAILNDIGNGDLLFYLDVNDKPINGIIEYVDKKFTENKKLEILAPLTNYPNFKFLSRFNRSNLSFEFLLSSLLICQPEAGALVVRNSPKARSILRAWYNLTLIQAYELDRSFDLNSRHDQETLYILSRLYKSIKFESWFKYKLTGKGLRKYVEFEGLR